MNTTQTNPNVGKLLSRLKETESQLGAISKECSRIKKALARALDELDKTSWPIQSLESLADTLKEPISIAAGPDLHELYDLVESTLRSMMQGFEQEFRRQLKTNADKERISFGTSGDNVTIGPFEVVFDRKKSLVELEYAKAPCVVALPLDATEIIQTAKQLERDILRSPDDLAKLSMELEEAILVSLARDKKSTRLPELRAELPVVHREMTFIRQAGKKSLSKKSFKDYPLARFVVEVASVIRSDENISADKSLRLETAVIENTGNRRKSVFIPKDLKKGYGEGMYYQAIILRQQT